MKESTRREVLEQEADSCFLVAGFIRALLPRRSRIAARCYKGRLWRLLVFLRVLAYEGALRYMEVFWGC